MSHPTFRKLFHDLALIALAVSLVWPPGVARANHDPVCVSAVPQSRLWFEFDCGVDHSAGGGTTTPTTTTATTPTSPDTDGDGVADDKDPCPKDKNGVKDEKGYCKSGETGQRNSSPGALQGFKQDGTGNQELYTNNGKQVASFDPDWLADYAGTPPGTTITVPVRSGQYVLLTYAGNGSFTGQYNGGGFNFYRPELVKKPVCVEAALARAKARLAAAAVAEQKALAAANAAEDALNAAVAAEQRAEDALDAAVAAEQRAEDALDAAASAQAADALKAAADATHQATVDAAGLQMAAHRASVDAAGRFLDAQAAAVVAQAAVDAAQAVYDSLAKNCP